MTYFRLILPVLLLGALISACSDEPDDAEKDRTTDRGDGDGDAKDAAKPCEDRGADECSILEDPEGFECRSVSAVRIDESSPEALCLSEVVETACRQSTGTCGDGAAEALWEDADGAYWKTSGQCGIEGHEQVTFQVSIADECPVDGEGGAGGAGGVGGNR